MQQYQLRPFVSTCECSHAEEVKKRVGNVPLSHGLYGPAGGQNLLRALELGATVRGALGDPPLGLGKMCGIDATGFWWGRAVVAAALSLQRAAKAIVVPRRSALVTVMPMLVPVAVVVLQEVKDSIYLFDKKRLRRMHVEQ